jgi:hypothetical protein
MAQNIAQLMAAKARLVQTTNTLGWGDVQQIANNLVAQAMQEAMDEEDRDRGEAKRLKAKGMQNGFESLFVTIEKLKQFEETSKDESGLGELEKEPEYIN